MRWWTALLVGGLVLSGPALAGKKGKKGKKGGDEEAPALEVPTPADGPELDPAAKAASMPKLELPCGYESGLSRRYALTKRSSQTAAGMEPSEGTSTSELTLTVEEGSGSQAVIALTYDSAELGTAGSDPVSQAITEKLGQVLVGKPVRLKVDHATHGLEIANLEAVIEMFRAAIDETIAVLEAQDAGLDEQSTAMLREMVADPKVIEASVLEDLRPLFDYTCGPFPVGTLDYEVVLENPLGGSPLPGTGAVTLTAPEDGAPARFQAQEQLDDARVASLLEPMLPPELPVDVGALQVVSTTALQVTVDAESGWVDHWRHERTVGAMGRTLTDTAEMRVLE